MFINGMPSSDDNLEDEDEDVSKYTIKQMKLMINKNCNDKLDETCSISLLAIGSWTIDILSKSASSAKKAAD